MIQTVSKPITFDEFIAWYPENSEYRYELHDGELVQMPKPIGNHSRVSGYIALKLGIEIERLQLPYFVPKECVVKFGESGYEPDIIVLNEQTLDNDPRWEKESTITQSKSAKLVIEVTSTNWSDDYALKLEDYEALGIEEYWICDYLGLGGKRYIGSPKQPTFSVYQLNEVGEYQVRQFRGEQKIESIVFPDLNLSLNQILTRVNL
jgi:Uma2 family endonuclease